MEERPMPYLHCPTCRLTVHDPDGTAAAGDCPRCGDELAEEPRSLFAVPPVRSPRFRRTGAPAPAGPTPEVVRTVLARRGGRWRREGAPPLTREA
jgi:hypothetical protein